MMIGFVFECQWFNLLFEIHKTLGIKALRQKLWGLFGEEGLAVRVAFPCPDDFPEQLREFCLSCFKNVSEL